MKRVGEDEVHGIDDGKGFVVVVIGVDVIEAVFLAEFLPLQIFAGDDGGQFGVGGVAKGGQDGDLGEVAESDDGVANLLGGSFGGSSDRARFLLGRHVCSPMFV
jgi:hypothetical protein